MTKRRRTADETLQEYCDVLRVSLRSSLEGKQRTSAAFMRVYDLGYTVRTGGLDNSEHHAVFVRMCTAETRAFIVQQRQQRFLTFVLCLKQLTAANETLQSMKMMLRQIWSHVRTDNGNREHIAKALLAQTRSSAYIIRYPAPLIWGQDVSNLIYNTATSATTDE